jgi:predicted phage baseplate assembly protein
MALYDWGNQGCYLPATALSAALAGEFDQLSAGDYLLFDNGHGLRDVVRLTVAPQVVATTGVTSPPVSSPPAVSSITIVSWSQATPLRASYCVSQTVVQGNLVTATHGLSVSEDLRNLKPAQIAQANMEAAVLRAGQSPPRQRLTLSQAPLARLDPETYPLGNGLAPLVSASASGFTARSPRGISTLQVAVDGVLWQELPTLLDSQADDQVYRVEIDDSGEATVVFGDGTFGAVPPATSTVTATYRAGGGAVGNVGADTLTEASSATPMPWLTSVTNPVAATGGRDLESGDHARRIGPATFHQPLVAVTASDYESVATAFSPGNGAAAIQRANANFQWNGSWLTVSVAADPMNGEGLSAGLRQQLLQYLGTRRLAGYDLEVTGPKYVPIEMEIQVSIVAGAQQGDVEQALLEAFSSGPLAGGASGFFNPNNFTFGGNLYVSQIYAAAMAVPGVASAKVALLARLHALQPAQETAVNIAQGFLTVGSDEILRLDNDPNFPQNGTLSVIVKGVAA